MGEGKVRIWARVIIPLDCSLFVDHIFGPLVVRDLLIPFFQTRGIFIPASWLPPHKRKRKSTSLAAFENHCCLNKFGCSYAPHLFMEDQ